MDAAILLVKPSYSSMAKAPTKLGELLGCGVPCLGSEGLADMAPVLERDRVGVVIKKFGNEEMRKALGELITLARDPEISLRCERVAEEYFSLASGVGKYDRIYSELGGGMAFAREIAISSGATRLAGYEAGAQWRLPAWRRSHVRRIR